jgi:hypothetical protein
MMSLLEEQSPLEETSSPNGRKQSGLVASFVIPKQKEAIKVAKDSLMKNLSSTSGSHQA